MTREGSTRLDRTNLGYLLARALQRWNARLYAGFRGAGFPQIRPAYGAVLVPLFEQDGLQMSALARRAGLSKQTMTTLVRELARKGLVVQRRDPRDGRATLVHLAPTARRFRPAAEAVLAELDRWAVGLASPRQIAATRRWLARLADIDPAG